MSDHAELRERLHVDSKNYGGGIFRYEQIAALLADYDRVVSEKNEMVARNKLLRNRPDLPLERVTGYDELVAELDRVKAERDAWRTVGELVVDYCQRMNFETNGETRGDRMYAAVEALLKGSE